MERYDLDEVKDAARGKWRHIIMTICGIRSSALTRTEKPCPKCGGTGRFCVYKDFDETGGLRCNQCHSTKNRDGFYTIMWTEGCTFPESIAKVAELLGVKPTKKTAKSKSSKKDPSKHLEFKEWNHLLALNWCRSKPGITPEGLVAAGAKQARYRKEFQVIALPINGKNGEPVGWCIYNITGGTLPRYDKDMNVVEQLKVMNTAGSGTGFIQAKPRQSHNG